MLSERVTQAVLRSLDRLIAKAATNKTPAHLRTGKRGEEDAYFYLRRKGYVMIARNFRTSRHRGEIDLIGWDKDVLCFIEVKTRTTHEVKPAVAAVNRKKRHDIRIVIRDYLHSLPRRQFPTLPQWRFDVVTVYYEEESKVMSRNVAASSVVKKDSVKSHTKVTRRTFELFQNAALSS